MQVPQFDIPYDPDGPPCTPYPGSILILGGYRWLGMDGNVRQIPSEKLANAEKLKVVAEVMGEDPQVFVGASLFGDESPVSLDSRTVAFWEAAAVRGGSTLNDLIV